MSSHQCSGMNRAVLRMDMMICMCTHVDVHVYVYRYVNVYVCVHAYEVSVYVWYMVYVHEHLYLSLYIIYIYMYIYIYICMCIHNDFLRSLLKAICRMPHPWGRESSNISATANEGRTVIFTVSSMIFEPGLWSNAV